MVAQAGQWSHFSFEWPALQWECQQVRRPLLVLPVPVAVLRVGLRGRRRQNFLDNPTIRLTSRQPYSSIDIVSDGVGSCAIFNHWRGRFVEIAFRGLFSLESDSAIRMVGGIVNPSIPLG